jgi:hypothetical protein
MVMETITRVKEEEAVGVVEAGQRIGVPVIIRPWWGSCRRLFERRHKKCGKRVYQDWYRRFRCFNCGISVEEKETEVIRLEPGEWICPARDRQAIKWPLVDHDRVIMWEGRCGARYGAGQRKRYNSDIHIHSQQIEVLDVSTTAMLVLISVVKHRLRFLIGMDDGHPFVHVVNRRQNTVEKAFDYMMPLPVFNAQMHGCDVKRQGDWFFVPRSFFRGRQIANEEKRLRPWPGNWDAESGVDYGTIYTWAPLDSSRHLAERLIHTWPYNLVKGSVTAPDHPTLQMEDWHCAIRNIRPCAVNPDDQGFDD